MTYQPDLADPEGRCQHCDQPPHVHDPHHQRDHCLRAILRWHAAR